MTITLTADSNTFITLAAANTYFAERLNSDIWTGTGDESKKKALIMATKKINKFAFIGQRQSITQDLEWPRYVPSNTYPQVDMNFLNYDYTTVSTPDEIKEATCEEALALLELGNSKHLRNQQMGIKSVSMGNESISYDGTGSDNKLLSQVARTLVNIWTQKGFTYAR